MIDPEVIFDEEAHTYSQAGAVAPRSVTGLLKKYGLGMDYSSVPKHILDLARQRGKAIAMGRALIVKGQELDPASIDIRISGYLEAIQKFWKDSKAVLIETEVPRISPLGFGFTADIFCWINGRRTVVDDKATFTLPKSIGPQTAGYKIGWNSLYPSLPIEDRYALWVKPDGTYRFKPLEDPDDETAFLDCLEADIKIERWKKKYAN
jgi:hypothetical protein